MRNLLLATALTCCSLPALAHQCNVELNGDVQLEDKVLSVTLDNRSKIIIDQNKDVFVDGKAIDLTSEQQQWVDSYYDGINQAAPQAAAIASEAVALASTALNEVFNELLGAETSAFADLSEKLTELDQQIQYNFYAEDGEIRLSSDSFENGDFFGAQWEAQFEEAIEDVVTDSIGHLMVAIGTQLIFSGGNMDEFEQKMERFGEQMENKIEYQATALEDKAEVLCATLKQVDVAETKLQKIDQLASLNIIEVEDQSNWM